MLSRLFIIGFLLCLPIALALFSQQITRTVAPPRLPTGEQQVKLLGAERNGRNQTQTAALGHEVAEGYTLRTIKHWGETIESDAIESDALGAQASEPQASGLQPRVLSGSQASAQPTHAQAGAQARKQAPSSAAGSRAAAGKKAAGAANSKR